MKIFIILGVLAFYSANAFGQPPYLAKFKSTYPRAKALHNCQICHHGLEKVDYAKDYSNNNHDFKAIEGFDSDADGFTNIDEINAGTQPGNRDSHPTP